MDWRLDVLDVEKSTGCIWSTKISDPPTQKETWGWWRMSKRFISSSIELMLSSDTPNCSVSSSDLQARPLPNHPDATQINLPTALGSLSSQNSTPRHRLGHPQLKVSTMVAIALFTGTRIRNSFPHEEDVHGMGTKATVGFYFLRHRYVEESEVPPTTRRERWKRQAAINGLIPLDALRPSQEIIQLTRKVAKTVQLVVLCRQG
ncbi:uncharacterized protein EV420DRAFT_1769837 [Desarmillaria tabescens]|uniref:Uncharacterized protein n=1 Tax=Armillaria tabescens TaxID=1929756 RepID=A0AA39MK68_ARMTA|nr:uncharacterized protein EV420DRAFT_1769837 [Desarmillaria tabescens]KAK0437911.1 hypothetical protein EV420DRAFT_1769837 [Desarmillaria tabescens]